MAIYLRELLDKRISIAKLEVLINVGRKKSDKRRIFNSFPTKQVVKNNNETWK